MTKRAEHVRIGEHQEHFQTNEELVQHLHAQGFLTADTRAAFTHVDRANFVPNRGPLQEHAYCNASLKHQRAGITLTMPSTMAIVLRLLEPKSGQKVLDVGTGTGYQAALLSVMTGPRGKVVSLENNLLVHRLARRAVKAALSKMPEQFQGNVTLIHADGRRGWPQEGKYDGIVVSAETPPAIVRHLARQLKDGGRIVAPTTIPGTEKRVGMLAMQKIGKRLVPLIRPFPVTFVPLEIGTRRKKHR